MDIPEGLVHSAFSQLLGCEVIRLETGIAEVSLSLAPELRNRGGVLHGGALFSLVDITMGLACSTSHGFDQRSATLECKINYVKPVVEGAVHCIATVLHPGRRTLVVEAEVLQAGKLMAKAQGTFVTL